MATATKTPAEKATKPKAAPAEKATKPKAAPAEKATRQKLGPQGWLQDAVLAICNDFAEGKVDTGDKPLTPHRIAKLVADRTGTLPSAGAVAACLRRWEEYGFATLDPKPLAFKKITTAGKKQGLEALVAKHRKAAFDARKG